MRVQAAASASIPRQQQGGCQRAAAGCGDRDRGSPAIWRLPPCAPQLHHRFVSKTEPVQAARADLAAEGVERQLAVERDALASLDEPAAFADRAKAERLEPGDRLKTEPVIELRRVDVGRLVVGALPQIGAGRDSRPSTPPDPSCGARPCPPWRRCGSACTRPRRSRRPPRRSARSRRRYSDRNRKGTAASRSSAPTIYSSIVSGSRTSARGLSNALARSVSAICASCSRVRPKRFTWRIAYCAVQLAAEKALKGANHCEYPSTGHGAAADIPPAAPSPPPRRRFESRSRGAPARCARPWRRPPRRRAAS